MSKIWVQLDDEHEQILDELIKRGIFKTKNDAIVAGIMLLGKEYGVFQKLE